MGKVNIKARIVARKVTFAFVYSHIFSFKQKSDEGEKIFFVNDAEDISSNYLEDNLEYLLEHYFSHNNMPIVDKDYFVQMASTVFKLKDELFEKINTMTSTFAIERMDTTDQCIFLIAYTERKLFQTPKEVLLNEMIELAKIYGDPGAPKLINGILHKLLS